VCYFHIHDSDYFISGGLIGILLVTSVADVKEVVLMGCIHIFSSAVIYRVSPVLLTPWLIIVLARLK
jgi:hypothetical protein